MKNHDLIKSWPFHLFYCLQESSVSLQQAKKSLEELEEEGAHRSVGARGMLLVIKVPIFIVSLFIKFKSFTINL